MRLSAPTLLAVALGAAAIALASCGSNAQLLPGEKARDITANLDSVKRLAEEGDCVAAESAATQVSEQIEALGGIDAKLKRALREGAARLNEVVAGCEETTSEAIEPGGIAAEAESTTGKDEEKARKEAEKEQEKEEKEREKEEKKAGTEEEGSEGGPALPPQANGEAKGLEEGGEEEEGSSGGIGPGAPVGGGD